MHRLVWVPILALGACTAGRVATWEKALDLRKKGDDSALVRAGDEAFAQRGDEAQLRKALEAWEKAAELNPTNAETLVKLARGYYLLADGHLSFGGAARKQEMMDAYEKGVRAGERALVVLSPEFRRKVQAGTKPQDAFDVLPASAMPALYWYAVSLGKWARARGFTKALFHRSTIKKAVETVHRLAPDYWFAGADRYLGAYYAYLPGIAGGDKNKAKAHFDAALKRHPNYFATKLLMAELYYVKKERNPAMFRKLLEEILKGDPKSVPGLEPEQRIEQRKAADLLQKMDDLF